MVRILHVVTDMRQGGLETMLMNYYRCIDKSIIQFDFAVHRTKRGTFDDEIEEMGERFTDFLSLIRLIKIINRRWENYLMNIRNIKLSMFIKIA